MAKVAIITDTNSGMSVEEGKSLGIHVLALPYLIDGNFYTDGVDLTHEQFYEKMEAGAEVSTSQPSPGDVMDTWDALLKDFDEIVYIPMSAALSQSYNTASTLAEDEPYAGKVFVVNNRRISVTQRQSAIDAKNLADKGFGGKEICGILEREAAENSIYITVDTLKYLKKGGRVTSAGAAIGTVLNIKPLLEIQGGKLDAKAKPRGMKAARKQMINFIKEDIATRFAEAEKMGQTIIQIAYTKVSEEVLDSWYKEVEAAFPGKAVFGEELALSIACHIGPGALAVTVCSPAKELW